MRKYLLLLLVPVLVIVLAKNSFANIGVGVGTGKIYVDEKLKPGTIYELPDLAVLNTGDVASDYEVTTEFREYQEELRPEKDWISYSPESFYLEPGENQMVKVRLNIPLKTEPGDYFAFLSAHPNKKSGNGSTTVGVAAAAKLYFTVAPANFIEGIYYRVKSLWLNNQPWTNIVGGAVVIFVLINIARRFISVDVNVGKKSKKKAHDNDEDE